MPEPVVALLDQARASRERAKRAKRLAGHIATPDVILTLLDYAQALERLAIEAEERANALTETPPRNRP
jgi:hypothetical protein